MVKKSLLLELTGEMPMFKIMDFLVENKGLDFTKTDIARGANISRASLFNYWPLLETHKIVRVTRKFGKTKLYTINGKSAIAKKIIELEKELIKSALQEKQEIKISISS